MSTPRKIRIKKIADFGAGSSGMDHNYGFIFSDDLTDWQQSKRLKANEYMREKYKETKLK